MLLLSRRVTGKGRALGMPGWLAACSLGIVVVAAGESRAVSPTQLSDARSGMTCQYYLAQTRFAWGRKGGDWVDADGVPYGAAAFATTTVSSAKEGGQKVEWDVTGLARKWTQGAELEGALFIRALDRGASADFHSRESANAGARPVLVIDWTDGRQTTLSPTADATILCTSVSGKGAKTSVQAGNGMAIALAFPFEPKGAAEVKKATLVLTTQRHFGRPLQLGVYQLRPPSALEIKPVMGIASAFPGDKGIQKHPDIIFATDFEASDWESEWSKLSRGSDAEIVDASEGNGFKPLQGKALRATVPKGRKLALHMLYNFAEKAGGEPDEAYFRYYLRLGENWQPLVGGKLPGLAGTYNKAGWGGRMSDGTNGWSARGRYVTHRGSGEPTPIGSYVYHAGMTKKYGSGWGWNLGATGLLAQNRWYSVEQYVRLNTPGQADGVLRAWIDGKLVFEKTDIQYRNVPQLHIENLWMNVYHGGTKSTNQDISLYIDNVVVARKYIGPMVGAPRS
jgi:hypothetical protein